MLARGAYEREMTVMQPSHGRHKADVIRTLHPILEPLAERTHDDHGSQAAPDGARPRSTGLFTIALFGGGEDALPHGVDVGGKRRRDTVLPRQKIPYEAWAARPHPQGVMHDQDLAVA